MQRLARLDGLRGLAALGVVVYHYFSRSSEIYPELGGGAPWLEFLSHGVQVFFVLSGFVIWGTLSRGDVRRFSRNRLIRLYPTYWICLTLTLITVGVFGLPGRQATPGQAAANYTMLQGYFGVPNVDGAYWTLAPELGFYVQCAVLWVIGILRPSRISWMLPLWTALAVAVNLSPQFLPGVLIDHPLYGVLHRAMQWIPFFVGGIAAQFWRQRELASYIPLVVAIAGMFTSDGIADGIAGALAVVLVLATVKDASSQNSWLSVLEIRPLLWLGGVSYVLYLLHQNIGYVVIRALELEVGLPQPVAALLALLGILLAAHVITKYVDSPARQLLRKRLPS